MFKKQMKTSMVAQKDNTRTQKNGANQTKKARTL